MTDGKEELARVLDDLRRRYDVFSFFERVFPVSDAHLIAIPVELLALLRSLPEFRELAPGGPPRPMQFAGDYGATAAMIIYKSEFDQNYYVVAPNRDI